jgi:hypothetical protein
MKTMLDAQRFRGVTSGSTRELRRRFGSPDSVTTLLRRTGPFLLPRDGYGFDNSWPLTDSDLAMVREHYHALVDGVAVAGIEIVRQALRAFTFVGGAAPIPVTLGLPDVAVDFVPPAVLQGSPR